VYYLHDIDESQQPTWPQTRHSRRCTQVSPVCRHSSQPLADGSTSWIWFRCVHFVGILFYLPRYALPRWRARLLVRPCPPLMHRRHRLRRAGYERPTRCIVEAMRSNRNNPRVRKTGTPWGVPRPRRFSGTPRNLVCPVLRPRSGSGSCSVARWSPFRSVPPVYRAALQPFRRTLVKARTGRFGRARYILRPPTPPAARAGLQRRASPATAGRRWGPLRRWRPTPPPQPGSRQGQTPADEVATGARRARQRRHRRQTSQILGPFLPKAFPVF
jgi:hypothetical protein